MIRCQRGTSKATHSGVLGPRATIANTPPLVTSNKGRAAGERQLEGRFDHLVPQRLHEPVRVRIEKFSAHPLEADAAEVYHDDGKPYYEVELRPEDGAYPLPYMARRADGSGDGTPFEDRDQRDASIGYGGRQSYFPDASRLFEEIDRGLSGRGHDGAASELDRLAEFDFVRVLPPSGYTKQGEVGGTRLLPVQPPAPRQVPAPTRPWRARSTSSSRPSTRGATTASSGWKAAPTWRRRSTG